MLIIDALHDRDFLRSAREESSVANFFHADDRGVVLQQHRNGIKVGDIFDDHADGRRLARRQIQSRRLKSNARARHLRLGNCARITPETDSPAADSSAHEDPAVPGGVPLAVGWPADSGFAEGAFTSISRFAPGKGFRARRRSARRLALVQSGIRTMRGVRTISTSSSCAVHIIVGEQIAHNRNLRQARPAIQSLLIYPRNQSAQNADFAFFQADFVLHFALADDGLRDAANAGLPVTAETSTDTFMLTSWFGCTCGVMSRFTPTSMY